MKGSLMKSLVICAAVLTACFGSGCLAALLIGAGAGVAGTAYYDGKLTSTVDAKPADVQTATEGAFKELAIKLVSSTSDSLSAKITGKTAENTSVTVTAEMEKNGQSKLGIRVGSFGDQALSQKIHTAIVNRLPKKDDAKKDVKKDVKKETKK